MYSSSILLAENRAQERTEPDEIHYLQSSAVREAYLYSLSLLLCLRIKFLIFSCDSCNNNKHFLLLEIFFFFILNCSSENSLITVVCTVRICESSFLCYLRYVYNEQFFNLISSSLIYSLAVIDYSAFPSACPTTRERLRARLLKTSLFLRVELDPSSL